MGCSYRVLGEGVAFAPRFVMVVDQCVRTRQQPVERGAVFGLVEIEHDRLLVGVEIGEQRALAALERPHGARGGTAGPFDLDDFGAKVGQQLRGIFAAHALCDFDDGQAGKGTRCLRHSDCPSSMVKVAPVTCLEASESR